ncbi:hypothetical protein JCM6292_2915 [Bacteroides pyogenes JCM 6292]|uniref:Uncharacterized protein n=2 Tax=Bacteroides pyogenes TaxID=310300 RepID=W4PKA3_9BACE|nr:hypothetical protein JCM6292_2915 [Bacteroides pyogenes JCM 6292]GAE20140.1 hypothetical protein JCM6294_3295 [Bacteroides pyogenes DSM 20611 = JCM 6294]
MRKEVSSIYYKVSVFGLKDISSAVRDSFVFRLRLIRLSNGRRIKRRRKTNKFCCKKSKGLQCKG